MSLLAVSLVVAFVAGVIALAMPCCFSVLLPSYFGSAFRKRTAVVSMTLLFGAGLAAIILPVTLLANAVGLVLRERHSLLFVAGGFFMVLLGLVALWGRSIFPQVRLPVDLTQTDRASVFTLGVFSGVATSCCAPVLAGLIVLSALSSSTLASVAMGLAYVAGMMAPLLLAALVWDRSATRPSSLLTGRMVRFSIFGREAEIHSSNLVAGVMFTLMGLVTIALGLTDTMIPAPGAAEAGLLQARVERTLETWSSSPLGTAATWGLVGFGLVVLAALVRLGLSRPSAPVARDPVCRMPVDPASAKWTTTRDGATHYFCSPECKDAFDRADARI